MNYKIKLRGGAKNDIPVLSPREIGICTDTNEVFVGSETGNKDFFKSINDKIGNGFTTENTITSQMNENTQNINNLQTDKANKTELLKQENGTFLPFIYGLESGINEPTYEIQQGEYSKIGNVVFIKVFISISSKNSLSGAISIQGLPFTSKSTVQSAMSAMLSNVNLPEGFTDTTAYHDLSKILLSKQGNNGQAWIRHDEIKDNFAIRLSGYYQI